MSSSMNRKMPDGFHKIDSTVKPLPPVNIPVYIDIVCAPADVADIVNGWDAKGYDLWDIFSVSEVHGNMTTNNIFLLGKLKG